MTAASVVVIDELPKDLPEVSLAEHDDVVEAFSAECAIDALDEAVGVRRQLHPIRMIRHEFSVSRIRFIL